MDLQAIKKAARELALAWYTTNDETAWAVQAILDVLAPLCENDPDVEEVVERLEDEWGLAEYEDEEE